MDGSISQPPITGAARRSDGSQPKRRFRAARWDRPHADVGSAKRDHSVTSDRRAMGRQQVPLLRLRLPGGAAVVWGAGRKRRGFTQFAHLAQPQFFTVIEQFASERR